MENYEMPDIILKKKKEKKIKNWTYIQKKRVRNVKPDNEIVLQQILDEVRKRGFDTSTNEIVTSIREKGIGANEKDAQWILALKAASYDIKQIPFSKLLLKNTISYPIYFSCILPKWITNALYFNIILCVENIKQEKDKEIIQLPVSYDSMFVTSDSVINLRYKGELTEYYVEDFSASTECVGDLTNRKNWQWVADGRTLTYKNKKMAIYNLKTEDNDIFSYAISSIEDTNKLKEILTNQVYFNNEKGSLKTGIHPIDKLNGTYFLQKNIVFTDTSPSVLKGIPNLFPVNCLLNVNINTCDLLESESIDNLRNLELKYIKQIITMIQINILGGKYSENIKSKKIEFVQIYHDYEEWIDYQWKIIKLAEKCILSYLDAFTQPLNISKILNIGKEVKQRKSECRALLDEQYFIKSSNDQIQTALKDNGFIFASNQVNSPWLYYLNLIDATFISLLHEKNSQDYKEALIRSTAFKLREVLFNGKSYAINAIRSKTSFLANVIGSKRIEDWKEISRKIQEQYFPNITEYGGIPRTNNYRKFSTNISDESIDSNYDILSREESNNINTNVNRGKEEQQIREQMKAQEQVKEQERIKPQEQVKEQERIKAQEQVIVQKQEPIGQNKYENMLEQRNAGEQGSNINLLEDAINRNKDIRKKNLEAALLKKRLNISLDKDIKMGDEYGNEKKDWTRKIREKVNGQILLFDPSISYEDKWLFPDLLAKTSNEFMRNTLDEIINGNNYITSGMIQKLKDIK
jgi:hypothetical protein